jgi:alkyl hydroperoxide reductase subunit F
MEFPGIVLDTSILSRLSPPDHDKTYDMLIIGGGAAAMCAAIYAARKMLAVAMVTMDIGGQMNETSDIENYLGFQSIDAKDLVSRFDEHVKGHDISIGIGTAVKEIRKDKDTFTARMEDGTIYSGKTVVYAAGERHRKMRIPGEKEFTGKGVSFCAICDAPLFKEKTVMIAGGGNSAFTTALDLIRVNAEIILVNFVKGWQADGSLQQRVRGYKKIKFLDFHEIVRIEGEKNVQGAVVKKRQTGDERSIALDGLFVEIGLLPNSDPVRNLADLNEKGEVVVDCQCRTNVPGLFAAGDVTHVPYKQIIIAAGEGSKAALAAYDYLIETNQL